MKSVLLMFCWVAGALGGEPSGPLTGNASVDFGTHRIAGDPRVSVFQEGAGESTPGRKSPWIAGALSLAIPGVGEMYAGDYLKGGIFLAAEAASWLLVYTYDKQGDDRTGAFQQYADAHWSAVRYLRWTLDYSEELNSNVDTTEYALFSGGAANCDPPFSCINWTELNRFESDIASGMNNGYTHRLPYYGEQQYFELIGKYDQFSRGWDDSDPADARHSEVPVRSTSRRFYEYAQMRAKANDSYDVASTFVSVAVLNHIISAADAFWTATRKNKALSAEVRMKVVRGISGLVPIPTAKVTYRF